jgi:guanylate kinase
MSKKLFVVSGPSGAGISDIAAAVFAAREDVCAVTPITARKMKEGEADGVGFFFYDLEGWNALKESGDMLECTEFAGNDYGTSRRLVEEKLNGGKHVLLNLEVDRAAQIKKNMPEAVCVYIEPSPAVLRARYEAIARSPFEVRVRLETADKKRALSSFCDARIVSDDLNAAADALNALIAD